MKGPSHDGVSGSSPHATSNRLQTYAATDIEVTFDPEICIHSGVCLRALPGVFDVHRKRWIRPELAAPEQVAAAVRQCPSGALQYRIRPAGPASSST
jgi:uncharacterized Fe-S cluster protein YjdI